MKYTTYIVLHRSIQNIMDLKSKKLSRIVNLYELSIAASTVLTAGSGVSHISIFKDDPWAGRLTAVLAVMAALLSAIKPAFTRQMNGSLAKYTKKYSDYSRLFSSLDKTVRELRATMFISHKTQKSFESLRSDFADIQKDVPANINKKKYNSFRDVVLQKFPNEYYWNPTEMVILEKFPNKTPVSLS